MQQQQDLIKAIHAKQSEIRDNFAAKYQWFRGANELLDALCKHQNANELASALKSKRQSLAALQTKLMSLQYPTSEAFMSATRACIECALQGASTDGQRRAIRALEEDLERLAVILNVDVAVKGDEIRSLWRNLSAKEKVEVSATIIVPYEGPEAQGRITKEVTRKRLLEYLRTTAHSREGKPKNVTQVAVPPQKRDREEATVDDGIAFHRAPPVSMQLPQNKHHHQFFEDVSPMNSVAFPAD